MARLSRNHAQRAQRLLVKLARVLPHRYNRPDHAPHLFLAKSPHFAHRARILLHPPQPRINFPNELSYPRRFLVCKSAFPLPMRENPRALYPLASFLYRASLMMAMNRIANSDGSNGVSSEGAFILSGSTNSAEHRPPNTTRLPKSAAHQILIHGTAIKSSRITLSINHLQISNRRQTAPFSRAPRAQKRESNESQPAR